MGKLKLGTLLQDLGPAGKGINQAYRGIVATSSGELEVFVKHLADPRELLVECACALLAMEMGLPVPEPLLVLVPNNGQPIVAFGSTSVSAPDINFLVTSGTGGRVYGELSRWPHLHAAGCFDEWIANWDRNEQNLLFDGISEFWLIDHGRCIPVGLAPREALPSSNALIGIAIAGKDETALIAIRASVIAAMQSFAQRSLAAFPAALPDLPWDSQLKIEILSWLESRQAHLVRLGSARIPARQGDLMSGNPP